jgi:hypothetical protein
MADQNQQESTHKVVGFFHQIWILVWKNFLLFRRNLSGMFVEIFVSYLFLCILLFLRYFVDTVELSDRNVTAVTPFRFMNLSTNRTSIYYYPNNAFVQGVVMLAIGKIVAVFASQNVTWTPTSLKHFRNFTLTKRLLYLTFYHALKS